MRFDGRGEELSEGLDGVERARGFAGDNMNLVFRDDKPIAFPAGGWILAAGSETDNIVCCVGLGSLLNGEGKSGGGAKQIAEVLCSGQKFFAFRLNENPRIAAESKIAGLGLEILDLRNQAESLRLIV